MSMGLGITASAPARAFADLIHGFGS